MSNFSKLFSKAPVEVPKMSGFDMSHINIGTLKVGTLTPVLVEPIYPNDKISVGANVNVQLPPMASDFIGKVDLRMFAFFVPYRILWQGWQRFYNSRSVDTYVSMIDGLPKIAVHNQYDYSASFAKWLGAGTLMDYLGLKIDYDTYSFEDNLELNNPLPLLAYHMIFDRWFRDKTIQRPLFASPDEIRNMINAGALNDDFESYSPAMMPYRYGGDGINSEYMCAAQRISGELPDGSGDYNMSYRDYKFADGSCLFDLRQMNWAKDYFTIATPKPQAGEEPAKVVFSTSGASGEFTIAALRAANALQKFAEKRNIAGGEYDSQILADWGVRPSDSVIQHPIYLGSFNQSVYNRSVMQSANGLPLGGDPNDSSVPNTRNPFASTVGAAFGKSSVVGQDSIVSGFHAKEHGIFMILACLVPHAFYASGTRKYLTYNTFSDFPNPNFVAIGDQEIKCSELNNNSGYLFPELSDDGTFGYTQRFAEKKFHLDEVHGLLRDGQDLQHFAVQRTFEDVDMISSDFLEIKQDAMDNVSAVAGDISKYGAWYEIAFKEHVVSAFPAYSIPTLGDEKHTKTITMDKGGTRL